MQAPNMHMSRIQELVYSSVYSRYRDIMAPETSWDWCSTRKRKSSTVSTHTKCSLMWFVKCNQANEQALMLVQKLLYHGHSDYIAMAPLSVYTSMQVFCKCGSVVTSIDLHLNSEEQIVVAFPKWSGMSVKNECCSIKCCCTKYHFRSIYM